MKKALLQVLQGKMVPIWRSFCWRRGMMYMVLSDVLP